MPTYISEDTIEQANLMDATRIEAIDVDGDINQVVPLWSGPMKLAKMYRSPDEATETLGPDHVVVEAVGPLDHDKIEALMMRVLGRLKSQGVAG